MTTTEKIFACFAIASLAGCATDLDDPDEAIVGGTTTTAFPEVGIVGVTNGEYLCTGYLVSPTIVITAAHCISGGTSYGFYTGPGTLETVTAPS
jgi:V8-like Glu-specific endopeptidase